MAHCGVSLVCFERRKSTTNLVERVSLSEVCSRVTVTNRLN
jgi:hypothetical protein